MWMLSSEPLNLLEPNVMYPSFSVVGGPRVAKLLQTIVYCVANAGCLRICCSCFIYYYVATALSAYYLLIIANASVNLIPRHISFLAFSISLEVMTLNPMCECVETSEGVPVTVTGVAQCKIMRASDILRNACEQFLGKSPEHIQRVVLQTLEGHLRAILGMK